MPNLRYPANKGCDDAYDVSASLTGYEPNFMAFSELNDRSGSFSYITQSSDLDIDDATLRQAARRSTPRTSRLLRSRRRVSQSVSQSSSSVVFDRAGKLARERVDDQSFGFGVTRTRTRTVLTASFLKTPKLRKWSIDRGNLRSETAQMHRLGLHLMNRDR